LCVLLAKGAYIEDTDYLVSSSSLQSPPSDKLLWFSCYLCVVEVNWSLGSSMYTLVALDT